MSPNMRAYSDMTAWSEIGPALLAVSDNGYDVMVGSTAAKPLLFHDFSRHPGGDPLHYPDGPCLSRNHALDSDAAGRYQFMGRYWPAYRALLRLPDFGPASQDLWFRQLVRECNATNDVEAGRIARAISKCASRWASFPGNTYGQRAHTVDELLAAFKNAGGVLA